MTDEIKVTIGVVLLFLSLVSFAMTASACYQQGWNDGHRNGYHFTDGRPTQ